LLLPDRIHAVSGKDVIVGDHRHAPVERECDQHAVHRVLVMHRQTVRLFGCVPVHRQDAITGVTQPRGQAAVEAERRGSFQLAQGDLVGNFPDRDRADKDVA
jgi:hypothetical protein